MADGRRTLLDTSQVAMALCFEHAEYVVTSIRVMDARAIYSLPYARGIWQVWMPSIGVNRRILRKAMHKPGACEPPELEYCGNAEQ